MRTVILFSVLILVGCTNPTGSTIGYQAGHWQGVDLRVNEVSVDVFGDNLSYGFSITDIHFCIAVDSRIDKYVTYLSTVPIRLDSFRFDTLSIHGLPVSISADYDGERWNGVHTVEQPGGFVDSVGFYMEYGQ